MLTEEQLDLVISTVTLETKEEAYSSKLFDFCLQHPIALIRGLPSVLALDLDLFSTKTLSKASPHHPVEVRVQIFEQSEANTENGLRSWNCVSTRKIMDFRQYAGYQASTFEKKSAVSRPRSRKRNSGAGVIWFGTNVDLSEERIWGAQLKELKKLPPFARVESPQNLLSHVGHTILGMNTVQMYLKVAGCRTTAHQENNNFCSINLNVGPGDCEWFAVPNAYWGDIQRLCVR
jgi:histone demethylase